MVKHFVLPYDPILHPRTVRPSAVSRRNLASGVPVASGLAGPLRVARSRVPWKPCSRPIRASTHRRRLAPISRRRHSRRALPRSTIHTPHRSLPGRRRLRHSTLPTALTRNRSPAACLAPALPFSRVRPRPVLALVPAPAFPGLRALPRRFLVVCCPPSLRKLGRIPCPRSLLLFSFHDPGRRRMAHRT